MIKQKTTGKRKGEWVVRIQPVNRLTGKRESWPVQYAKTKKQAKRLETEMWADYQSNFDRASGNSIFSTEFRKFVDQKKPCVSLVTYRDWDYTARVVEDYFGSAKIRQINTQVISNFARTFVKNRNLTVGKSSAIDRRLTHIRCFFHTLVGKTVRTNPVPRKALTTFFRRNEFDVGETCYVFSEQELKLLKTKIANDLHHTCITSWLTRLAIWIELETGMRPGEVQALRFKNVTSLDGYTTFKINDSWSDYSKSFNGALKSRPRGSSRLCLPLSRDLVNVLKEFHEKQIKFLKLHGLCNPEDLIFLNIRNYKSSSDMQPVNQRSMNQMLDQLCDKLNIDSGDDHISLYSFRHTICTKLANKEGISYPWAAARMGNSLSVFMNVYVKDDHDLDDLMVKNWLN